MKPIFYQNLDYYFGPETPMSYDQAMKRHVRKRCIVTKYFPKYIKKMYVDLGNGLLRSKLKKAKIIEELQYPLVSPLHKYWRTILTNKMKTLKTVPSLDKYCSLFRQEIKALSGLRSLSVSMPRQIGHVRPIDQILVKYFEVAFKRINQLRNLRLLSINDLSKNQKDLLEKLNSSSRLLSSITTFHIACNGPKTSDSELFSIIQSQKNIINSMTSFDIGLLCSPSHHISFRNLANSCPKLQHLRFEFSNRNLTTGLFGETRFAEETFPIEVNYLAALKTFHSLRSLHLNIADTFTCLKDLVLPPSIQNLVLNFQECVSKETMLKIDPAFCNENSSQFFQENQTLLQFYDQFRGLSHLETFKICFSTDSDSESYQYQNYLLHSLLRRIPKLKKITSGPPARCPRLNKPSGAIKRDLYLPQFLDSCQNYNQTLQTLEIDHGNIFPSDLDLSAFQAQFPQLSSVKITGKFEEYTAFNPPILPLLEQLISLGASPIKIRLLFQIDNTVKTLLSLLKQISQFQMPTKLYLEMDVRFWWVEDLEDLRKGFENVISDLANPDQISWKAKRTSLKIYTSKTSEEMEKFLDVFGQRFEYFEICPKFPFFS